MFHSNASVERTAHTVSPNTFSDFNSRVVFSFCSVRPGVFFGAWCTSVFQLRGHFTGSRRFALYLGGNMSTWPTHTVFSMANGAFIFLCGPSAKSGCLGSLSQAGDLPGSHPLWRLLMGSARSWHTGGNKGLVCLLFQV